MDHIVAETAARIFADLADPQTINRVKTGAWKETLWQTLDDAKLPLAWVPERLGGSGASLAEGFAILGVAGRFALAVPLAETLASGWLLANAGIEAPRAAMTVAPARPHERITMNADGRLNGRVSAIPFAQDCAHIAVLADNGRRQQIALVDVKDCRLTEGRNLAGDPVYTVTFDCVKPKRVLGEESDHRLLNGLQMIASLLSLQARASTNGEVASGLTAAADRIATIGRIHRRLHSLDGVQTFALKQYLDDLCRDISMMLSSEHPGRIIVVEGVEITLPAVTAIPLGFVANELVTNAAKYGTGRITVSLEPDREKGYALSVSNDGPGLPEGFDPAARKGLGMRIVRALVEQIGGELRIGRADKSQGARFTVLFS
jgi:two-component system, sensor histidine kinase PdtaS